MIFKPHTRRCRLSAGFVLKLAASRIGICALQLSTVLALSTTASAADHVEAYRGEPFGIGRVTIDLAPGASSAPTVDDRIVLDEAHGRVLYPVMKNGSARRLLRDFLGIETPGRATFLFMFRGDEPLDLVAYTPTPQHLTAQPADNAQKFNDLLGEWWNATSDHYAQVFRQAAYPVVVDNYLTATWARRLNREMPEPKRYLFQRFGIGAPWISQLMANEAYQTQVERDLLTEPVRANDRELVSLPIPPSSLPTPPSALPAPLPSTVEPLAAHVPEECFYLRFGNFTNYLWFRDFMRHWQGDLGNMLVVESVDRNISERLQQQIAVGETKIARVMGPTVVKDVAFIGLDAYLRDGAAMGILFQANNSGLLKNNLNGQRQDAKSKHSDAVEENIQIAGHDVSYIHTPDGRLRSYYAVDGDFHFVASSRVLIERFLQAGAGDRSLAASADFQDCRDAIPLTRDDTIFLFASAPFLQNLASPHYRVELDRRLRSVGEMRAIQLASLAAAAEAQPAKSIEDLIAAELLPAGFGERHDGSKLVFSPSGPGQGEGAVVATSAYRDSLRGDAGWMTPIPDMPVDKITTAEARHLAKFEQDLHSTVGSFAPVCAAVKRTDSTAHKGWDHIAADVRVARYSQTPVAKWPAMLGEAQTNRVAPIEGDAVSLEIVLGALGDPVHLFGGIRDFNSPLVVRQGEVQTAGSITDSIRAYIGGWPKPHLIDRFVGSPKGPLDADGIARTGGLFDLWFRRADDFFLFSFKRDVLLEVGRQLAVIPAERPAQIRLHIDDLTNKQIATTVNGFGYSRARDTSASASRFMNSLSTQLHVAPEDARALGENLVGGKFACPLGGKYVLVDPSTPFNRDAQRSAPTTDTLPPPADGAVASATVDSPGVHKLWVSTAPPAENRFLLTVIPADYQMPLMTWFRGLTADVARMNDELWLNAQLDMVHIEVGPPEDPAGKGGGLGLPNLGNLFGGFGAKKDEAVKPASATEQTTQEPKK
ncbi:MAG TPA: hypothetical protein VHU84_10035 [Lacipirellulaceae bacterium]|nr:hypothetical protein [Lacipirellulaceae bacterium]